MAKKSIKTRSAREFKFPARAARRILFPAEAMPLDFYSSFRDCDVYVTTVDGRRCRARMLGCWRNTSGRFDEELDSYCMSEWGIPFASVKAVWASRLRLVGEFWHLMELSW